MPIQKLIDILYETYDSLAIKILCPCDNPNIPAKEYSKEECYDRFWTDMYDDDIRITHIDFIEHYQDYESPYLCIKYTYNYEEE